MMLDEKKTLDLLEGVCNVCKELMATRDELMRALDHARTFLTREQATEVYQYAKKIGKWEEKRGGS